MSLYVSGYQGNFNPKQAVTVANGGTVSSAISCGGLTLCGVLLPAALTSTAMSFLGSVDGTNFFPVRSTIAGTLLSYTVAQGTYCALDPKDFQGLNFIQIKTGSTEGAARTLIASLKGI